MPCTHVQARQSCRGFIGAYIFYASGDSPFAVKFVVVLARGRGSLIVAHSDHAAPYNWFVVLAGLVKLQKHPSPAPLAPYGLLPTRTSIQVFFSTDPSSPVPNYLVARVLAVIANILTRDADTSW